MPSRRTATAHQESPTQENDASADLRDDIIKGNVGYGRPPEHTRFQKGQSGNPSGRRKMTHRDLPIEIQATKRDFLAYMDSTISVRENGIQVQMTVRQASVRALAATALKGGQRAQAELLYRDERLTRERALEIERETYFWKDVYCAYAYSKIAEAKANGKPAPKFLPHPDDIEFEPGKAPRFVGPWDEESERKGLENLALIKQLLLQHELDERLAGEPDFRKMFERTGSAFIMAQRLNDRIAPSLRLSEQDRLFLGLDYRSLTKRQLLSKLYKGWNALGFKVKRGEMFPPAKHAVASLEKFLRAWHEAGREFHKHA